MVNELRAWRSDLPAAIRAINSKPAALDMQLKMAGTGGNVLTLTADVLAREQKATGALVCCAHRECVDISGITGREQWRHTQA